MFKSLFAATILALASSVGLAQADERANIRAATAEFNSEQEALRSDMDDRLRKATVHLAQSDCGCDTLVGTCVANISLVAGDGISTYTINVSPETLKPKQCVKVSTFITTQWDLDNNTPINEQLTFYRGGRHEEDIDHLMWNQQVPILAPDTKSTCELCQSPADTFCPAATDLRTEIREQINYLEQGKPEMINAVAWANDNSAALPSGMGAELVAGWRGNLDQIERTLTQLGPQLDKLDTLHAEWCQG